jgi:hypothetical protein
MADPHDHRPDFMVTLGLMPPYLIEDVKQAYRDKVKDAHPDRGGSVAAFNEIQQAFERAQAYVEFRGDRRGWIAAKMAHYAALQRAIERLEKLGATVTTFAPAWLEQSYGDFAQLTETVKVIRLEGPADGDAVIHALVADQHLFRELESLALPKCRVTDEAVLSLAPFHQLKHLDLSQTRATALVLDLIDAIESLRSLNLEGSQVGWLARRGANARLRRRQAE